MEDHLAAMADVSWREVIDIWGKAFGDHATKGLPQRLVRLTRNMYRTRSNCDVFRYLRLILKINDERVRSYC